jgi:hypothetical protein
MRSMLQWCSQKIGSSPAVSKADIQPPTATCTCACGVPSSADEKLPNATLPIAEPASTTDAVSAAPPFTVARRCVA